MGATVPTPPILRRPSAAAFSQTPVINEVKPISLAPQQEFTSLAAMASEPPAQPMPAASAPRPQPLFRRRTLPRTTRYKIVEF